MAEDQQKPMLDWEVLGLAQAVEQGTEVSDDDFNRALRTADLTRLYKNKTTLGHFVNDNINLLSALGIFIGLTIFSTSLPLALLGQLLSFILFAATLLLCFELWTKFPPSVITGTWRLYVFKQLMGLVTILTACFWVVEFRTLFVRAVPFFLTTAVPILWLYKWRGDERFWRMLSRARSKRSYMIDLVIMVGAMLTIHWLWNTWAAPGVTALLEQASRLIIGPPTN